VLELFFSRLCQCYTWLGGVNTEIAGKQVRAAYKMDGDGIVETFQDIDLATIYANSTISKERLDRSITLLDTMAERDRLE
jgi:hypothetical protein